MLQGGLVLGRIAQIQPSKKHQRTKKLAARLTVAQFLQIAALVFQLCQETVKPGPAILEDLDDPGIFALHPLVRWGGGGRSSHPVA